MNKFVTLRCAIGNTIPRLSKNYSMPMADGFRRRVRPVNSPHCNPRWGQVRPFSEGSNSGPEEKEKPVSTEGKPDWIWGFKSRDQILEVLNENRSISQHMFFTSLKPLQKMNISKEGIEFGTIQAFLCIAEMFRSREEGKFEYHSASILDGGLAMQFAKQIKSMKLAGLYPSIELRDLKSSLLYSVVTFEEVAPDFEGHWSVRYFGKNILTSFITIGSCFFRLAQLMQPALLQVVMHVKGKQRISYLENDKSDQRPPILSETNSEDTGSEDTGFEDFDHVWLLEAKIDFRDFIAMNQMPTGFESGEDHENIEYSWIVKDINQHMESLGEQNKWNIRW